MRRSAPSESHCFLSLSWWSLHRCHLPQGYEISFVCSCFLGVAALVELPLQASLAIPKQFRIRKHFIQLRNVTFSVLTKMVGSDLSVLASFIWLLLEGCQIGRESAHGESVGAKMCGLCPTYSQPSPDCGDHRFPCRSANWARLCKGWETLNVFSDRALWFDHEYRGQLVLLWASPVHGDCHQLVNTWIQGSFCRLCGASLFLFLGIRDHFVVEET